MIHLDTSFLIHALVPGSAADEQIRRWLRDEEDLGRSSVAWSEFLCGPVGAAEVDLASGILQEIAPFTADAAVATANAKDFERLGVETLGVVAV